MAQGGCSWSATRCSGSPRHRFISKCRLRRKISTGFSGLSFSYNVAYAVFGGLTPVALSLMLPLNPLAPAHYVAVVVQWVYEAGRQLFSLLENSGRVFSIFFVGITAAFPAEEIFILFAFLSAAQKGSKLFAQTRQSVLNGLL